MSPKTVQARTRGRSPKTVQKQFKRKTVSASTVAKGDLPAKYGTSFQIAFAMVAGQRTNPSVLAWIHLSSILICARCTSRSFVVCPVAAGGLRHLPHLMYMPSSQNMYKGVHCVHRLHPSAPSTHSIVPVSGLHHHQVMFQVEVTFGPKLARACAVTVRYL